MPAESKEGLKSGSGKKPRSVEINVDSADTEDAKEQKQEKNESVEDVEEVDAEEEKPTRSSKGTGNIARPSKVPGKGMAIKLAAVAIVVVIVASAAYMLVPSPPTAKITITGLTNGEVQVGKALTFDGSGSASNQRGGGKISAYAWDFGDGQKATSMKATHTYTQPGTYKVSLTVTDSGGMKADASTSVKVVGMVVTLPNVHIGDTISYDLAGYVDMSNPDGFWTYTYVSHPTPFTTVTVNAKVTQAHIEIDTSQYADTTITTSLGTAEDGFAQNHSCMDTKTEQNMKLTGWAVATMTPTVGPTTILNQTIGGSGSTEEHTFSDLSENRTVKMTRSNNYNIGLGSGSESEYSKKGSDVGSSYPKKREEFSVDALRDNRTFMTGDSGSHEFTSTNVFWSVVGAESVKNVPCLKIHVTMDAQSLAKNGFTSFDLYAWISSVFPTPLKVSMQTEGSKEGNTVVLNYTMTYKSYTLGTTAVPFGSCAASTPEGHFYTKRPNVSYANPDQYGPAMGNNTPSASSYTLPNAVSFAKTSSSGLRSFLTSNPEAFLVNAYYNETNGGAWNLTFGCVNSSSGYYIIVTPTNVRAEGAINVNQVGHSIKEYPSPLTFTGAEEVFKSYDAIRGKVYYGNRIDLSKYSFGTKAGVPAPRSNFPIETGVIAVASECFFYVEASDGSYSAGVDAETGQLFFVSTHTNG